MIEKARRTETEVEGRKYNVYVKLNEELGDTDETVQSDFDGV